MIALRQALLLTLFTCLTLADTPVDYRYQVEVLTSGIDRPMELEVAPDGRVFFNDYYGNLKIYHPTTREVVEAGQIEVFQEQENGFLGFALDKNFPETQWIYLFYSPTDYVGQRLSRFEMNGDQLVLASEKTILEFPEQRRRCCHHAGSVEFAPDGCLLISTGDNTDPGADTSGYAPIDERPDHFPVDAQKSSANTHDLRGKILRIRPLDEGGYEIPEGNLFPQDGSQGRPEIFVMGCRNPWRMSVDEETGIVYWGDVGPDAGNTTQRGTRGYDELNQARQAGNFGWPYFVGNNFPYADYDFATGAIGELFDPLKPVNDSPNNTGSRILPPAQPAMIYWPYAESPEFPMLGSGGRTACAGPVFHYRPEYAETDGFPEHFDDCLLFWDWQRPFMKWARFDSEHYLSGIEEFTRAVFLANENNVPNFNDRENPPFVVQRPVDADFGDDGCLYLLDYGKTWGINNDSRLLKISYRRGNLAPVARITESNVVGREPLDVRLSGTRSKDPEGEDLQFAWHLHPENKALGSQSTVAFTIDQPGNYIAALTVTDARGAQTTSTLPIIVGNSRPKVTLVEPVEGDFFSPGQSVRYEILVEDHEDGSSANNDELMDGRTHFSATLKNRLTDTEILAPGLQRMRSSDCFNCHATQQKIVGPPLIEIAKRYRNNPEALATAVQRVIKGSTGVWGPVPMLPHSQHAEQEVEQMVRWIFDLTEEPTNDLERRGLFGEITIPSDTSANYAVLKASYSDLGREPAGSLLGETTLLLRNHRVEAESCDAHTHLNVASNNLGSINHGATATYRNLNLSEITNLQVRVSSGGPGGTMEVRQDSASGPILALFKVPNTGGWGNWIELNARIKPQLDRSDVVLVFRNPGKGGLMDVDWLRFDQP